LNSCLLLATVSHPSSYCTPVHLANVRCVFALDRNSIQDAGVQYILDTVLDELQKDDTRRFIYVEVAFFSRWWREQHDFTRHRVKALVNAGQREQVC